MILIIFGIYALIAGRLMVTRRIGLRDGARIGGLACIATGLGFFGAVFVRPIASLSTAMGWGDTGATILGVIFQLVVLALIFVLLILLYGNNHSSDEARLLNVAVAASAGRRNRQPPQFLVRGVERSNGKTVEFESRATSPEAVRKSAEAMGLDLATLTVIPLPAEAQPADPGATIIEG